MDDFATLIRNVCGVPLVTKWVVVAEVIDEDGDKALCELHDDNLSSWDAVGLLSFQLEVEKQSLCIAQQED